MKKIKELLNKALVILPKHGVLLSVVVGYLVGVLVLVSTYFGVWVWSFINDKAGLGELMILITEVTSAQAIAFISFIGGCFVDLNGNGIPDNLEGNNAQQN